MKYKFKIHNTELYAELLISNNLIIKSHPRDYNVIFDTFNNMFKSNEILLIDEQVQKIYNIQHSKMIIIKAEENNKSIETVLNICEKLMEFNFDQGNTLIVIGGGIIQDVGAYTAKTFKRGIKWVFYPTTLLSQCDSCIGGKTALNFKNYKNQLALFSAPDKVIIDVNFLDTLPERDIISGHGEIVKLFLIGGKYYIDNIHNFSLSDKIYHALSIKKAVVEYDEFENLERKSLNYGHSFGHVIESLSNYSISHGEAVLLGLELINRLFTKSEIITNIVNKFTNLEKLTNINVSKLITGLKTDKKVKDNIIKFVVVTQPGETIFMDISINNSLECSVNEVFTN
jgi:3-dehydroquinate synthase